MSTVYLSFGLFWEVLQPKNPNTKPRLQKLNNQSASTKTMPHGKHQNLCQMQVHSDQNRQLSTGNTTTTITTTILLRCNLQFVDVYITVQFGLWLRLEKTYLAKGSQSVFTIENQQRLLEFACLHSHTNKFDKFLSSTTFWRQILKNLYLDGVKIIACYVVVIHDMEIASCYIQVSWPIYLQYVLFYSK